MGGEWYLCISLGITIWVYLRSRSVFPRNLLYHNTYTVLNCAFWSIGEHYLTNTEVKGMYYCWVETIPERFKWGRHLRTREKFWKRSVLFSQSECAHAESKLQHISGYALSLCFLRPWNVEWTVNASVIRVDIVRNLFREYILFETFFISMINREAPENFHVSFISMESPWFHPRGIPFRVLNRKNGIESSFCFRLGTS